MINCIYAECNNEMSKGKSETHTKYIHISKRNIVTVYTLNETKA